MTAFRHLERSFGVAAMVLALVAATASPTSAAGPPSGPDPGLRAARDAWDRPTGDDPDRLLVRFRPGTATASRRSARAWRGVFLHLWFAGAVWLMLHHLVVLIYWTLHWLNFWIFFVLLAFVQMRRSEGPADKHQSA